MSPAPDDLGDPTSYLTLEKGAPVISSDGERIGRVEEVRADETVDVFDGFVLGTGSLGLDRRYVAAEQVDTIFERGVVLALDAASARDLPHVREDGAGNS